MFLIKYDTTRSYNNRDACTEFPAWRAMSLVSRTILRTARALIWIIGLWGFEIMCPPDPGSTSGALGARGTGMRNITADTRV